MKIKVLKAGYFAGSYYEASSVVELTERQLDCAKRRDRGFEVLEGAGQPKVAASNQANTVGEVLPPHETPKPAEAPKGSTVKELKATLDDAGVDYPVKASKPDLQALVDDITGAEGMM
tara:strand:- start:2791 stop:3144 length:354 start_codon:yes stop_codon:yes gene_type:complete